MNLDSAKNAVEFCLVRARDDQGRPTDILVPGHDMARYAMNITRLENGTIYQCGCLRIAEDGLCEKACPGNSNGKVCYHVLAGLMYAVRGIGHLEFFESLETPLVLQEMGRKVITIKAGGGGGVLYAVFFKYRKKKRKVPVQQCIVPQGLGPYDPAIRA